MWRPKMFNSTAARRWSGFWCRSSLSASVQRCRSPSPRVKGVIKPWVAVLYVVAEVGLFTLVTAFTPPDEEASPFYGLALVLLIVAAATHIGLLDNERVTVGT